MTGDKLVTRRRELEQRQRKLDEIGGIMRSMKNLALMETRKLARFLEAQAETVRQIETAAADFLAFHHQFVPPVAEGLQALLVIGSERGFCGDFNEELLNAIGTCSSGPRIRDSSSPIPLVLAVGSRLVAHMDGHAAVAGRFEGPAVAEDVPKILNRLVPAIGQLQQESGFQVLQVLHHRSGADQPCLMTLLPPFSEALAAPAHYYPPVLNLVPERFFSELVRHYLFAVLHEIFHASLMAENQRRIQHLEGAVQRLEEKIEGLARHSRAMRQEEITEEIEVILLSVEGVAQRG